MALRLFNTMPSRIEDFHPLRDGEVRMYACGPTVYDYGHIGNFRTFIAVDLLRRFFRQSGYSVRHVMNITDVDDKIIRNAARDGVSVQHYTAKYEKGFLEDAAMINIEQPALVRATEYIPRTAVRIISALRAFRATESYPRKTLAECSTVLASTLTNMTKTARGILRYGKLRSRTKLFGIPRLAQDGPGGTSNAP